MRQNNPREITRVDFYQVYADIVIREWYEGWKEGQTWNKERIALPPIRTLLDLCDALKSQGYTVEMCNRQSGRALRGKITRVDFEFLNGRWQTARYPFGWTAKTQPLSTKIQPENYDIDYALEWCIQHGWTVRRWDNVDKYGIYRNPGARAFLGKPMPIRDAEGIRSMRNRLENNRGYKYQGVHLPFDLAYDL